MTVFVDSNYFIALGNPEDSLHEEADILSYQLVQDNVIIAITNFVFLEIVTVLSQRASRVMANRIGNDILQNQHVNIIHVTESLQTKSWEMFQKIERKNVSFVDCSIIATMEFEEIRSLLTFDKTDFTQFKQYHKFSFYNR